MRDFNFFNDLANRKSRKTSSSTYVAGIAMVLALAMGLVSFFYLSELRSLRGEKAVLENGISDPAHQKAYTEVLALSEQATQLEKEKSEVESIHQKVLDSRVINNLLMKEIAMAKPNAVAIKSIYFTQEGINIEGTSVSQDLIARFEHNLRGNVRFLGPFIPMIREAEGAYYEFTLNFMFDRPDEVMDEEEAANGQG